MASIAPTAPWYPWFKTAVFALLGANTAWYLASGTLSEALDSVAWLTLLLLFELETGGGGRVLAIRSTGVVRGVRLAATAALIAALAGYLLNQEWLDVLNVSLWVAVVALLEFEVRHGGFVERHRSAFVAIAAVLYGGLALLVAAWSWRGEWFDAYDAALWLVAFATIEMNLLARAYPASPEMPGAPGPG